MLADEQLAEMRGRCEAATQGPWVARVGHAKCGCCDVIVSKKVKHVRAEAEISRHVFDKKDSGFIAHARTDLPACLDEIDRLKAEVAKWEKKYPLEDASGPIMIPCGP